MSRCETCKYVRDDGKCPIWGGIEVIGGCVMHDDGVPVRRKMAEAAQAGESWRNLAYNILYEARLSNIMDRGFGSYALKEFEKEAARLDGR